MGRIRGKDLIDVAKLLALASPRKPKQAELRRAVSSAYYALFLTLGGDAADLFISSSSNPEAWRRVHRALDHGRLRKVCRAQVSGPLSTVSTTLLALQEARHDADYDPHASFGRAETLLLISAAEQAIAAWRALPKPDRVEFLACCLFPDR